MEVRDLSLLGPQRGMLQDLDAGFIEIQPKGRAGKRHSGERLSTTKGGERLKEWGIAALLSRQQASQRGRIGGAERAATDKLIDQILDTRTVHQSLRLGSDVEDSELQWQIDADLFRSGLTDLIGVDL